MYAFILGVLASSTVLLVIQVFKEKVIFLDVLIGIIFMFIGIFISSLFKEK